MKYLFIILLLLSFTQESVAQFGLGIAYGVDGVGSIEPDDEAIETVDLTAFSFRPAVHLYYRHKGLIQFKTGVEFTNRTYSFYNPNTNENFNYQLDYIHIPFVVGLDLVHSESFSFESFINTQIGMGVDVLTGELLNSIDTDTGFSRVTMIPQIGTDIGIEAFEKLRISLGSVVQYPLNNTYKNEVIGKGRVLTIMGRISLSYYFARP